MRDAKYRIGITIINQLIALTRSPWVKHSPLVSTLVISHYKLIKGNVNILYFSVEFAIFVRGHQEVLACMKRGKMGDEEAIK